MLNSATASYPGQMSARTYFGYVDSFDPTDRIPKHTPGSLAVTTERRYGHRPAIVLSSSGPLRKSLEQALFARGAAVANLGTLPASGQVQDLLTSGLIVLAPPDNDLQPDTADWIEAAEATSTQESVNVVLQELERRGVLPSSGLIFPGDGI